MQASQRVDVEKNAEDKPIAQGWQDGAGRRCRPLSHRHGRAWHDHPRVRFRRQTPGKKSPLPL